MLKKLLVIPVFAMLFSCSNGYEYWELGKFNLVDTALKEEEPVKVIYSSQGPAGKRQDYYIHLVVVSQQSGDTVNVLTPLDHGLKKEDADKIFNFNSENSFATKMMMQDMSKTDSLSLEKMEKTNVERFSKVARDPRFDEIADNDYPTVIGTIGNFSIQH